MSKKFVARVPSKPRPPRPKGFRGENFRPGSLPTKIIIFLPDGNNALYGIQIDIHTYRLSMWVRSPNNEGCRGGNKDIPLNLNFD